MSSFFFGNIVMREGFLHMW